MELESVFRKINFVSRYQDICSKHNDFENSMSGNNKKAYSEILQRIDDSIKYSSPDRTFKTSFSYKNSKIEMVLSLNK